MLAFCVACSFFVRLKFSLPSFAFLISYLVYLSLVYLVNGGAVVLNFIYLAVILFYFYASRVGRDELLYYSFLASFFVVFLYVFYLFFWGASLEPVTIGGRIRYYFGFTNPNKVGIVAYSLVVLSALYFWGRHNFALFFICLPLFAVIFYSDSRTSLYALVLFFLFAFFPVLTCFKRLVFLVPIIFLISSFYISCLSGSEFANSVLSNRPIDFYDFIAGLRFYDFIIGANSDGYRVDNSYILAYFSVGPLGMFLFFCLLFRACRGVLSGLELAFIVSVMAYGLMEGILVRVEFPIVVYFYYLILGRENTSRFSGVIRRGV